jgi:hypothetical protein
MGPPLQPSAARWIAFVALSVLALASPNSTNAQVADSVPATVGIVRGERPAGRCMETHLREAAALNRARMGAYSRLAEGRSRGLSRRLIWAERLAIPIAWYVDRRAEPFLRAGIPIVCDDFVPMSGTPPLTLSAADPLSAEPFLAADARRIARAVRTAMQEGGFPATSKTIRAELERLESAPIRHCMLRHLLESALRISHQAPLYAARARELGVADPGSLSRLMLDLHLAVLGEAARMDRRAAPLQAEGIPILYHDVPPIPPFADG